jgi:hypothetical protein
VLKLGRGQRAGETPAARIAALPFDRFSAGGRLEFGMIEKADRSQMSTLNCSEIFPGDENLSSVGEKFDFEG